MSDSDALRRYGPLGVIVVLLVAVGALVVLRGGDDPEAVSDTDADADGPLADGEVGAPEPTGRMPVTYAEAEDAGSVEDHDWGERCDPATGKVRIPSVYAAPCVPVFVDDDNGGATTPGVSEDSIKVVRYVADASTDLTALLNGMDVNDSADSQLQTVRDYVAIFASRAELYGRTVEVVDYPATGPGADVVAAKADATEIASELQPFAVIGGPQLDRGTFAQELSSHGIVCIDCAGPVTAEMADAMEPYVWGALPSADQFLVTLGAWAEQLGDEAEFAGGSLKGTPRKAGVIHFDQDPPLFEVPEDQVPEGIELIESYVFDFATMPQKAAELVAQFKEAGITTIQYLGDPVMPIYLTKAATDQEYFPEWVFTGTYLTDTNLFGRQYDQEQMAHAFGISQLAAPTTRDLQDPTTLYRWYFGGEDTLPPAQATYAALYGPIRFLVNGLQMAGPDLSAETFARGVFRIPPAGGGPTTPQVSYGSWGYFPETDYQGIDDSTEIWWDATVDAPDETGQAGRGVWRRAHGAQRFINEDDTPAPAPFVDPDDTVTVVDEIPAGDAAPDYPPPPGSPAAG